MNAPTQNEPGKDLLLIDVLNLYEQRFSQEGVALKLGVKPHRISAVLSRNGLKQSDVVKRIRAGETAAQIAATAKPVVKVNGSKLAVAVANFIVVFKQATAGGGMPQPLAEAFAAMETAAAEAGAAIPAAQPANPAFIRKELEAQANAGVQEGGVQSSYEAPIDGPRPPAGQA